MKTKVIKNIPEKNMVIMEKMSDDIVLLYGKTELPANDCKVKFKNKHGKEYAVEVSRLIQVFNNIIWENKKSVK